MSTAFLITPFSPERAGGEPPQVYEAVQKAVADAEDCALAEVKAAGSPDALRSRGYINLATGAFDEAVASYRLALAGAADANTQFELGLASLFAHQFEGAQTTYGEAASRASAGDRLGAVGELEYWVGRYPDRLSAPEAARAVTSIRSTLRAH
jgi:tetratricopeptide (TPR) repeat protein